MTRYLITVGEINDEPGEDGSAIIRTWHLGSDGRSLDQLTEYFNARLGPPVAALIPDSHAAAEWVERFPDTIRL